MEYDCELLIMTWNKGFVVKDTATGTIAFGLTVSDAKAELRHKLKSMGLKVIYA